MKRFQIIISLAIPIFILVFFRIFPELDPVFQVPLLHFYIVTFFTFTAVVAATFTAISLGKDIPPRHQLLATAFAVMSVIFLIHGITTPGALLLTFNPGITWAAWLTMFLGGLIFAIAALDRPSRPLKLSRIPIIQVALAIFCLLFILIVLFTPQLLTLIDEQAGPWHETLVTYSTFLLWLGAAFGLILTWRETRNRVDGVMALTSIWLLFASMSMHEYPLWHLSWWLYHFLLLLAAITTVVVLVNEYEQLRQFRLTYYFAAVGLILTGGMALLASFLFSRFIEIRLYDMVDEGMLATAVVQARVNGLIIAGLSMGLLYVFMLFVIRRADRLITHRNEELSQAYAELKAAKAMRDDLTDMIVHDLRSPLTSINLSIDLLENIIADPQRVDMSPTILQRAKSSSAQMMQLIDQLLDVTRLESGQLLINRQNSSLTSLLQEKEAAFSPRAEQSHKQFQAIYAANLPSLPYDKNLISRVLDNLITNALKYTHTDGKIELSATENGRNLIVQVKDDGDGIPPEAATHIFDKFYQVKGDNGEPLRRGTGLGLTFCKLVVEAHQGRIWVESSPGEGSTFSFTLPLPN